MYWGAADEARADADDPKRRVRRLGAVLAITVLSIGGTVAMASATTTHANAAAPVAGVVAPDPALAVAPKPVVTTPPTPAAVPAPVHVAAPRPVARPAAPAPARAPAPAPAPAPVHQAVTAAASSVAAADSCTAAVAYLGAHSAPGFQFECPGYALGHQAMTCVDVAGVCPGARLIVISNVCPASYMNEAHNSWILTGLATGSIDPYGYCS
jgi:hypothetical protein